MFGRECPQAVTTEEFLRLSSLASTSQDLEDCLHINIYTSQMPGACARSDAVMFYIHGGSFRAGSARAYRPNHLLEHDVILVTVQYRLGPFGFLSLENEDVSGNMGLLDQIMALTWVNRHIGAFCGDKDRITVLGQSAGGAAVSILLLSPMARGLFQQGIVQSGSCLCEWAMNYEPLEYARSLANQVGCDSVRPHDIASCLRNLSSSQLVEAQAYLIHETMVEEIKQGSLRASHMTGTHAIVQKTGASRVLQDDPRRLFDAGHFLKVPLMVGVTKHEGTFILGDLLDFFDKNVTDCGEADDEFTPDLLRLIFVYAGIEDGSDAVRDVFQKHFFKDGDMGSLRAMIPGLADISGSLLLKACTFKVARLAMKYSPTFVYSFNYKGKYTKYGYGKEDSYSFPGGVAHSDELLYLFPTDGQTLEGHDKEMARTMVRLWTNFAIYGDPGGGSHRWPPMSTQYGPYLVIDRKLRVGSDFTTEYRAAVSEGIPPDRPPQNCSTSSASTVDQASAATSLRSFFTDLIDAFNP